MPEWTIPQGKIDPVVPGGLQNFRAWHAGAWQLALMLKHGLDGTNRCTSNKKRVGVHPLYPLAQEIAGMERELTAEASEGGMHLNYSPQHSKQYFSRAGNEKIAQLLSVQPQRKEKLICKTQLTMKKKKTACSASKSWNFFLGISIL